MANKKRKTKFQTYPQAYQFGGLSFLEPYQNLTNQWSNFWRTGDYFQQNYQWPGGTTFHNPQALLYNTVNKNNLAASAYSTNQKTLKDTSGFTGQWGDDAHNYYYNKTLGNRYTPEQLAAFGEYEKTGKWNDFWTKDPDGYADWKKGRDSYADAAGQEFNANAARRQSALDQQPRLSKEMGEAFKNTTAGIFTGLNYMNAYTPPETIYAQEGSKGIMYSQYGDYIKGPGMAYSPMMKEFGGIKVPTSKWTHFPNGSSAISALDSMLTSGRSKIYKEDMSLAEVMTKYDPRLGNTAGKFSKYTIKDLKKNSRLKDEFLQHLVKNEVPAQDFEEYYVPAFTNRIAGPSLMDYQVTSRQDGGNVNLTGYTPGTPTMENSMNEIPSGDITMEQTPIDLLAIGKGGAHHGFLEILKANSQKPNKYQKVKSTVEIPLEQEKEEQIMAKYGKYIKKYNDGGDPTNPPTKQLPTADALAIAKKNGLLLDINPDNFYKLHPDEQALILKNAFEKFNNENPRSTKVKEEDALKKGISLGKPVEMFIRPLSTTINTEKTIVEPELDFRTRQDMAYAQAVKQGLSFYTLDGKIYNTLNDPNYKAVPKKSSTSKTINTSQTGLARDLIGSMQFGGIPTYQTGGLNLASNFNDVLQNDLKRRLLQETNHMLRGTSTPIIGQSPQVVNTLVNPLQEVYQGAANQIAQPANILPSNVQLAIQHVLKNNKINTNTSSNFNNKESNNVYSIKGDRTYEYSKDSNGEWLARKKGSTGSWVYIGDNPDAISRLESQAQLGQVNIAKTKSGSSKKSTNTNSPVYNNSQSTLFTGGMRPVSQDPEVAMYDAITSGTPMQQETSQYATAPYEKSNMEFMQSLLNSPSSYSPAPGRVQLQGASNMVRDTGLKTFPRAGVIERQLDTVKKDQLRIINDINDIKSNEWLPDNIKKQRLDKLVQELGNRKADQRRYQDSYAKGLNDYIIKNKINLDRTQRSNIGAQLAEQQKRQRILQQEQETTKKYQESFDRVNKMYSEGIDNYDRYAGQDSEGYKSIGFNSNIRILRSNNGQYKVKKDGKVINKIFKNKEELLSELTKNYKPKSNKYGGYVPKFQFGGSVNDQHAIPVFGSFLEDYGLTEVQTEKGEVAALPDGSIADVKAKELHKNQDKDNVTDILQQDTYIFSNDPKMKFSVKSKIGGVELGDMKLGKSAFKYKENEITDGPEDILLKDMFFNGRKKELTTADIAKNIKKNLPLVDLKNDYFADRAIEENKDQRKEYISILKAFNEYKKPKPRNIPKAQYGMQIQPTQNGLEGVMGYGMKQADPFNKMDNNMISMWNIPQPKLPPLPKMYEDGGNVEHAQLGKLLRYTVPGALPLSNYFSNRAKRRQEAENRILAAEAQGYRDQLQQGVDRAGLIGNMGTMGSYMASLNVPLQKYDDQSEQMALYNAAANRAAQRLEASKYSASQGIGGASSLARYTNPTNYGDYLAKVQSESNNSVARINQAIADLDMQRANQNVNFISTRNAGRNQAINTRDTQLYNANVQGISNVGRSLQESTFNSADTRYRLGNEKMAYDAYLKDKAQAAKDRVIQGWEGSLNALGQIGLTAATGGFGSLGGGSSTSANVQGAASFVGFDPASFSGPNFYNPAQTSPVSARFDNNYNDFSFNPSPIPMIPIQPLMSNNPYGYIPTIPIGPVMSKRR